MFVEKGVEPAVNVPVDEGNSKFYGVIVQATEFEDVPPDPEFPGDDRGWKRRNVVLVGTPYNSESICRSFGTYEGTEMRGPKRKRYLTALRSIGPNYVENWVSNLIAHRPKKRTT